MGEKKADSKNSWSLDKFSITLDWENKKNVWKAKNAKN